MSSPSRTTPTSLCDDLECWMTNLPEDLKNVPLINLAIPGTYTLVVFRKKLNDRSARVRLTVHVTRISRSGSHDSFTSTITSSSKISPDAEPVVQNLKCLGPLLGVVVSRWARTQDHDITRQLSSGVRYFDLRISTKEGTEQLYFVHGQYSVDVVSVLNEIENFLDLHPKEVRSVGFRRGIVTVMTFDFTRWLYSTVSIFTISTKGTTDGWCNCWRPRSVGRSCCLTPTKWTT